MKLNEIRYFFALDVERNDTDATSNASVFNAIAVKVYDRKEDVIVADFRARLPQEFFSGEFAKKTLWPVVKRMPEIATQQDLYSNFWQFWSHWRDEGARMWVDTALLESEFVKEVMRVLGASFREGPWRVDDVRVLMLALGYDADEVRSIVFSGFDRDVVINRHHPAYDCEIVIECLRRCLKELKA